MRTLLTFTATVLSVFALAWAWTKLGAIDLMAVLAVNIALLIPMALVVLGLLNAETYNRWIGRLNALRKKATPPPTEDDTTPTKEDNNE